MLRGDTCHNTLDGLGMERDESSRGNNGETRVTHSDSIGPLLLPLIRERGLQRGNLVTVGEEHLEPV